MSSKNSDLWQTPDRYLDVLYKHFDNRLTLDVTSPRSNQIKYSAQHKNLRVNVGDKRINSEYYYTEIENCFGQEFPQGKWFMNPPFSNPKQFLEKLVHQKLKTSSNAITLLKSGCIHNVGTASIIWGCGDAICFHSPRLSFCDHKLVYVNGTDFDCVSVYFGSNPDKFCEDFAILGECRLVH